MRHLIPLLVLGACWPGPIESPDDRAVARATVEAAMSRLDTMRLTAPYPTTLDAIGVEHDSLTSGRLELGGNQATVIVTRGITTCSARLSFGEVRCEEGR